MRLFVNLTLASLLATPAALLAEYRLPDYSANRYAIPADKRDLWSVQHGVVEARVEHLVAFFSRADKIFSTAPVVASGQSQVQDLLAAPATIPAVPFSLFRRQTLEDWMETHPVTGLLIMQSDRILFERYQYGREASDRMLGMSMSKTLVGLLTGIALQEKAIASLDDKAETYEPRLRGHEYGATTIRSLLTMTSGMAYQETRDAGELWQRTAGQSRRNRGLESVTFVGRRAAPQGHHFNYNSVDTQVLSLVLRAATGRPLADYMAEKLWRPMGAESSAFWLAGADGTEAAFAGFSATLRDWGRLGLLLANEGQRNGQAVVPADYLAQALAWRPSSYGYQVWLTGRDNGQFALLGVRGQTLYVDTASKLVMVLTAVREQEQTANTAYDRERQVIWQHLLATFKR